METYDDAAFESFCAGLINAGFSPVRNTRQSRWTGPIRASLRPLTAATRMTIHFYPGWPLRYAHIVVDGLRTDHASEGIICLWAEDDPAQIAGRDLQGLWHRLDEWASQAQNGFRPQDRALDAYLLFEKRNAYRVELPFGDLIRRGNNGFLTSLCATKQGNDSLIIETGPPPDTSRDDKPRLKGAFYLRRDIGAPPRDLESIRSVLTRRQSQDLERGLAARSPRRLAEPSGGHDFIVIAWPRHDGEHDALVIGFEGQGDSLEASAMSATPNDMSARQRRAGPDVDALRDKKVLIAGAGSVGGHVAVSLASSGVGTIHLSDDDYLASGNLVRHVSPDYLVGYEKTRAVSMTIDDHAPWTTVHEHDGLPYDPTGLSARIDGVDLVVDCTGIVPLSAALAEICRRTSVPLITGALFHQGALARVQRQAEGDTPIAARPSDSAYSDLPSQQAAESSGFLELGCTAPINNAPPAAVLATAAEITNTAIDFLTGRGEWPDERIIIFRTLAPPFDRPGILDPHPVGGDPR